MKITQDGMVFEGTPEELREYFKGKNQCFLTQRGPVVLSFELDYLPAHEPNTSLYETSRTIKQSQDDEVVEHFKGQKVPWKWTPDKDKELIHLFHQYKTKYKKLWKLDKYIGKCLGVSSQAIQRRRSHLGLVKYKRR